MPFISNDFSSSRPYPPVQFNNCKRISEENTYIKVLRVIKNVFISLVSCLFSLNSRPKSIKNQHNRLGSIHPVRSSPKSNENSVLNLALIAGGIATLGLWLYFSNQNPFLNWYELSKQQKEEFEERLNPVCEEAVLNYCQEENGEEVCISDFLDPDRREFTVESEHNTDLVCPVYLRESHGKTCSELVGQKTKLQWLKGEDNPAIFPRNHLRIPYNASKLSKEDQFILKQQFPDGVFKTHVFCSNALGKIQDTL